MIFHINFEYAILEDGDKRMGSRQPDSLIVPWKPGNAGGGKGAT